MACLAMVDILVPDEETAVWNRRRCTDRLLSCLCIRNRTFWREWLSFGCLIRAQYVAIPAIVTVVAAVGVTLRTSSVAISIVRTLISVWVVVCIFLGIPGFADELLGWRGFSQGRMPCEPQSGVNMARSLAYTVACIGALVAVVQVALHASTSNGCPAWFSDLAAPVPEFGWPKICATPECAAHLQTTIEAGILCMWAICVIMTCSVFAFVMSSQAYIAAARQSEALESTERLRNALRFISHEARSPLGGAILSLSLLDQSVHHAKEDRAVERLAKSGEHIHDLYAALDVARRQLDDLLHYEQVTDHSIRESGTWSWMFLDHSAVRRTLSWFATKCTAERVRLDFSVIPADATSTFFSVSLVSPLDSAHRKLSSVRVAKISTSEESKSRSTSAELGVWVVERAPAKTAVDTDRTFKDWEFFMDPEAVTILLRHALQFALMRAGGSDSIKLRFSVGSASLLPDCEPARAPDRPPTSLLDRVQGGALGVRMRRPMAAVAPSETVTPMETRAPTFSLRIEEDQWQQCVLMIEVLDSGSGMTPERLVESNLFAPFRQLRTGEEAARVASNGLGMSIVKSIVVDQLGGRVGFASSPGQGSLFFAHIPVHARPLERPVKDHRSVPLMSSGMGDVIGRPPSSEDLTRPLSETDNVAMPHLSPPDPITTPDLPRSTPFGSKDTSDQEPLAPSMGELPSSPPEGSWSPMASRNRAERQKRRQKRDLERQKKLPAIGEGSKGDTLADTVRPLVCVVDDDGIIRRNLARLMEKWGLRALEFADGAQFVAFIDVTLQRFRAQRALSSAEKVAHGVSDPPSMASSLSPNPSRKSLSTPPGTRAESAASSLTRGRQSSTEEPNWFLDAATGDIVQWPVFVTLDAQMPVMDGFEVLEYLRKGEGLRESTMLDDLTIVSITGNAVPADRHRLEHLGVRRVITKPVEPHVLAHAIERLTGLRLPPEAHTAIAHS
jgi:signal transduction histidine kinase/FixJ family two-component response regulator